MEADMTMRELVSYSLDDGVATLAMDDGKANVMSEAMLAALNAALDRAQRDRAVVLLTGRPRMFSGGYDLAMFSRSREELVRTLKAGGDLVLRMFEFPLPIVAACTGHAVAQGAFTLLASDVRVGAAGAFRIGLNEVVIGLTIPHYGIEIARARLTPSWFNHATVTGAFYPPAEAATAGFLDRVVHEGSVLQAAREEATRVSKIDIAAHAATKKRARRHALEAIRTLHAEEFSAA
jgi:enoyl-CoA hydratase